MYRVKMKITIYCERTVYATDEDRAVEDAVTSAEETHNALINSDVEILSVVKEKFVP